MPAILRLSPESSDPPADAAGAFGRGAALWIQCGSASAGIWWENVPPHPEGKVATIGAWMAGTEEENRDLLRAAMAEIQSSGSTIVLAPMDGNTWRRYRCVTWSDGRPPFFLEPFSEPDSAAPFLAEGFEIFERYSSGAVDLTHSGPDLSAFRTKLESKGVHFAPMSGDEFPAALREIYTLSLASFARNVYYTSLDWETFAAIYTPLRPLIRDGLVWTARDDDGLAAYLFTIPDRLDASGQTVILKTLASRSDPALAGIGSVLTGLAHEAAKIMGFTTAIHALEHESNQSQRLSRRFGAVTFREYALLGRRLEK
ncbi:MAG: hypothetical protein ACKO2G_15565 [Verrucomicrobiales bacterium]